jgi:hypothetical protein
MIQWRAKMPYLHVQLLREGWHHLSDIFLVWLWNVVEQNDTRLYPGIYCWNVIFCTLPPVHLLLLIPSQH